MSEKEESIDICKIVQDLLPLYCDGQASEESINFIEKHIENCYICKEIFNDMNESIENIDDDKDINIFKKVKLRNRIKVIFGIIIGIIICAIFFVVMFIGIIPVNSNDLELSYSAYVTSYPTDENGASLGAYNIAISFERENGKVLDCRSDNAQIYNEKENSYATNISLEFFSVLKLPFDERGEKTNKFDYLISSETPFSEDDILTIKYSNETVIISLKEIAEEEGIQ